MMTKTDSPNSRWTPEEIAHLELLYSGTRGAYLTIAKIVKAMRAEFPRSCVTFTISAVGGKIHRLDLQKKYPRTAGRATGVRMDVKMRQISRVRAKANYKSQDPQTGPESRAGRVNMGMGNTTVFVSRTMQIDQVRPPKSKGTDQGTSLEGPTATSAGDAVVPEGDRCQWPMPDGLVCDAPRASGASRARPQAYCSYHHRASVQPLRKPPGADSYLPKRTFGRTAR